MLSGLQACGWNRLAGREGTALRRAHAGLVDVLGDGLIDGRRQGQVEEAVGLRALGQ